MKRVLTFAAVLMFASMFTVSQAQAHSHGGSRGSSPSCSHHDGHHGCNGSSCNGKGCNGKNGNPDGWNTIHPIPAPKQGTPGGYRFPINPVVLGNLNGKPSGHGLYTGNLHQWGLGGPAGRPVTTTNGQIPNLGTGFAGFTGAVGKEVGGAVTSVLNAGGAVVGGVAKGVGAAVGGVANGVGSVLSGVASGVGDVVSGIGSALGDLL